MTKLPSTLAAARPLPTGLGEEAQAHSYFKVETYPHGAVLYRPGEPADRVFLLRSGRIRLLRPAPQGATGTLARETLHSLLRPGDLFGEALRPPDATMDEFAVAHGETEVWSIDGRDLRALVEARPPLALEIIRGLAERNRSLQRRLNALTFKEVPARLSEALLALAETHGVRCPHGGEIDLVHVTQQDLADLVGASRSFVSTLVNEMKRDGLLGSVGRTLCLKEQKELRRLASRDRV